MRIIKDKQVAEKLGCSVSTVWRSTKRIPDFPRPIRATEASTGWLENEVDEYINKRAKARMAA